MIPANTNTSFHEPKKETLFDHVKSITGALLLAILIRTVLVGSYNIPSGSMIPSLLVGDYLFVSKFSYGYSKFSLPFGYFIDAPMGRILDFNKPKQGDVAVFRVPKDTSIDYVKRIIGIPGDRIQMRDGILYINDVACLVERIEDYQYVDEDDGQSVTVPQFIETLPGGVKHRIIKAKPFGKGKVDNTPIYLVPQGHYFAMGDNRDSSLDSRYLHAVGYVPLENFIGRAQMIFFSTDGTARFWEFWKWPVATRFARIFNGIH